MKFWITGADGLVGTSFKKLSSHLNIPYLATSRKEADITHLPSLLDYGKEHLPTHIFNCAAYTNVDLAEKEKESAFAINTQGAANLATVAQTLGAKLIHISTNYIFDGTAPLYTEISPAAPINVYGKSKWEGELEVLKILPSACIVRTSWVFGKKGKNLISSLCEWLKTYELVRVVSDQYASLTFVEDLSIALFALRNQSGIFNFSNLGTTSRYEIALELQRLLKEKKCPMVCSKIEAVSAKDFKTIAPRPLTAAFDLSKYSALFGSPRTWQEALREYLFND